MSKKFYLNYEDGKVAGVCAGLAKYFDVDVNIVRLAAVLLALVTIILPFVAVYCLAWVLVPSDASGDT